MCILFLQPVELWTGKQLFSVLVRPNAHTRVFLNLAVQEKIYSKKKGKKEGGEETMCGRETMCPNDGYVYFRNSELLSGQVGKATLGNYLKECAILSVVTKKSVPCSYSLWAFVIYILHEDLEAIKK